VSNENNLVVLEETYIKYKTKTEKALKVQCTKCMQDSELYGDATYIVSAGNFKKGQKPCGCSKSPKRTKEQWEIILKRKAKSNNHEFLGFVDEDINFGQNTKLNMHCNTCQNDWNTASLENYIQDRGCPKCANKKRGQDRSTSTQEWISRFMKTGQFDGYLFERQTQTSRLWNVVCPKCGTGKVFTSDRSNLVAGKIPCDCKLGGGFNKSQNSYFYLLKINVAGNLYCGYGITNYPDRRLADHQRELLSKGFLLQDFIVFSGDGTKILEYESALKRELPKANLDITGFRKESTSIDNYDKIRTELTIKGLTLVRE